jgi:hypothetical protein
MLEKVLRHEIAELPDHWMQQHFSADPALEQLVNDLQHSVNPAYLAAKNSFFGGFRDVFFKFLRYSVNFVSIYFNGKL